MNSYTDHETLLNLSVNTVKSAAGIVLNPIEDVCKVEQNLRRDVKVAADRRIEEFILNKLEAETTYSILSEESRSSTELRMDSEYMWIIDPLDGSFNFSRGIPLCCISLALWRNNVPLVGVIYDFNRDEIFYGLVGKGAWLNGMEIKVGDVRERSEAVLCTGFPVGSSFSTESLNSFIEAVQTYKKIRYFGTAALSLAYVACGRADIYMEENIKLWDVGAGLALVSAASGKCSFARSVKGENYFNVSASNEWLLPG